MEKTNDMKYFMQAMGINRMPEIFVQNWEAAMNAFPGNSIRFLSDEYIEQANKVLFLTDEKLRFFYSAAEMIRSDMELCRYAWLWHYCLFINEPFPDIMEVLSWPFPETQMGPLGQMFHGIVLLSGLEWLKRFYEKRGIPLKILIDTLSEFDICLDEHKAKYGEYGVGLFRTRWLLNHFSGRIYRLGRLEFMYSGFAGNFDVYRNIRDGRVVSIYRQDSNAEPGFVTGYRLLDSGYRDDKIIRLPLCDWREVLKKGTGQLEVHITLGERLSTDSCRKSLAMANDFYARHFPDQPFELFTCQSWLMDPQLSALLPDKTNIVRFQKLFCFFPKNFENTDVYRFAFDVYDIPADLSTLPERSSMHKALKAHLLKGNSILSSGGFILKEEYKEGAGIESYEQMYSRCCGEGCSMTSRERVLSAIHGEHVDYVPCSPFFKGFCTATGTGDGNPFPWGDSELVMAKCNQDKLGLDPILAVDMTGLEQAAEAACQDRHDGNITTGIKEYVDKLVSEIGRVKSIADQYSLATAYRAGLDLKEAACHSNESAEKGRLHGRRLELGHRLNMHFTETAARTGIDIILLDVLHKKEDIQCLEKWKDALAENLREEISLVHSYGKAAGFILRTDDLKMLDFLADLDFDCIVSFDNTFDDSILKEIMRKLGSKKSLLICPDSVYDMTRCSAGDVEKAVKKVYDAFGKKGILITACPSSKCMMTWENTLAMAKEWRKYRIAP